MKLKFKEFYEKIKGLLAPYRKNIIEPLLKILAIIIICAVVAHLMGGHETLLEYAAKNGSK